MSKTKLKELWTAYGIHIFLIVLGLVLLVSPDGATVLVVKILAWMFILAGIVSVAAMVVDGNFRQISKWVWAVLELGLGALLLARPLLLTDLISRVFGLMMVSEGIRNWRAGRSRVLAGITVTAGAVLFLLHRTLTHTILGLCGLIMIIIGVVNIIGKYRDMKRLEEGRDPNIIDVDIV